MKKNYTLKITLAMLFVVLVSLVSFVGVYKGKNLLKEYSLGMDFKDRKVAMFSVKEDETTENTEDTNTEESAENTEDTNSEEETAENTENANAEETTENAENANTEEANENTTEETANVETENNESANTEVDKTKQYNDAKNIIERRLASMNAEEYDVRLDESTGAIMIEVPTDVDSSYLSEVVSKGKAQILNQSTNEVIVDVDGFKDATATLDTTSYSKPVVLLKIKFTNDAKNKFKNVNTNYTDSDGNEQEATFEFTLDGESLYSDTAKNFVDTAKNGSLDLVLGQGDDGGDAEENYKSASALVSVIKNGELPVEYNLDTIDIVSSNISIKSIVIIASIIGVLMLVYAIYKFKGKGVLPVISLVGLVASILLVLRYTNVKITLFTILGLAVIVISNYILILKTLGNEKTFKQNFIEILNMLVPCFIVAIVFCCAPYLQLATLGMTIFWGVIVMFIYNAIITRILIDK